MIGNKEGETCNRDGCTGTMQYKIEGCTCHINPPCSACVNAPLVCDRCGEYAEEDE